MIIEKFSVSDFFLNCFLGYIPLGIILFKVTEIIPLWLNHQLETQVCFILLLIFRCCSFFYLNVILVYNFMHFHSSKVNL